MNDSKSKKHTTYMRLIGTRAWRLLRRDKISRFPLCEDCLEQGKMTPATEVHHVVPCETAISEAEMKRLMFNIGNLRSLCHTCHVETHKRMGRSGKEAAKRLTEERLENVKKKFFD